MFQAATGEDQAERELLDQLRGGQDRLTGLAHACEDSWVLGVVRLWQRRPSMASRSVAVESDEGIAPGKHALLQPIRYVSTPLWDARARRDTAGH